MKYYLCFAVILLFAACKKEEDVPVVTPAQPTALVDFKLVPIKDATWSIHTQGVYRNGMVDTSVHYHTIITCTNIDTMALGLKYHRYDYVNENGKGVIYLREDSVNEKLYALAPGFPAPEGVVVDFGLDEVGDVAKVPQQWPQSIVSSIDSLTLARQYIKRWRVAYTYDKTQTFFYRAYGVGGQTGIIPSLWIAQGTEPRSLDFTYKGETVHFDFDVHK